MEITLITTIAVFCICFLLGFSLLKILFAFPNGNPLLKNVFTSLLPLIFISFTALFFLYPRQTDFIFSFPFWEICLITGFGFLIYMLAYFRPAIKYTLPGILLFSTIFCLLVPEQFLLFDGNLPFWADRCFLTVCLALFCFCFPLLNGIDGIAPIMLITPLFGIFILSLLDGAPLLLGFLCLAAASVFLSLLVFNIWPARFPLNNAECLGFAFLSGCLILKSVQDGAASCNLVFNMFYIYTILFVILQKITLRSDKQNITADTPYYKAFAKGLLPTDLYRSITRICVFLIIIGTFQLYAPNSYSIPLLSIIAVVWFGSALQNWDKKIPTLKEMNQNIVREVKNNINEIKDNLRKDN